MRYLQKTAVLKTLKLEEITLKLKDNNPTVLFFTVENSHFRIHEIHSINSQIYQSTTKFSFKPPFCNILKTPLYTICITGRTCRLVELWIDCRPPVNNV